MFTGIIEATGNIKSLKQVESHWRLDVNTGKLDMSDVNIGDSIAVNGCCLTVVDLSTNNFEADVSNESMQCTTFDELKIGSRVNLEKAMRADSRFGGHIVSGHVDGVGKLSRLEEDGNSIRITITAPRELAKYIAAKGSICIDGTSLTINDVDGDLFTVNIIPHTQKETVIGEYVVGQSVNLEVDLLARYLERLSLGEDAGNSDMSAISRDFLAQYGFNK